MAGEEIKKFMERIKQWRVSLYLVSYPLNKLHNYDGSWIEWSRTQEPTETGAPVGGGNRALLK